MPEHFFVIGAQRSGTTYLYEQLDSHPEIAMGRPLRPEPKFFMEAARYERGLEWYVNEHFSHAEPEQLLGEKSVGYLESALAADRIASMLPDARIVVILREPISRAVSHHGFSTANGLEHRTIEDALASETTTRLVDGMFEVDGVRVSSDPFAYRRRGRYADDLALWYARFPPEQIRVMVMESTVGRADAIGDLYQFLGVDPTYRPPTIDSRPNSGQRASRLPDWLLQVLGDYYSDSNRSLEDTVGIDISVWN